MNENKEKSAVGIGVPATAIEKVSTESITDNPENIKRILEKLTELLQMTAQCCDVAEIRQIDEKAVITYINGDVECINIGGDSGICTVYDIVRKLMWR